MAEASPEAALPIGTSGALEPVELLGRGGQGVVCRARDTELSRTVALKV